jgi:hypothetical protein
MLVPVCFPGGAALVDLAGAAVDLRAVRHVVRGAEIRSGAFTHILGAQSPSGQVFVLEGRFLSPGEPVHVSGRVVRLTETSGLPIPVIGGTGNEPLVVHAGSLGTLTRHLWAERAYLAVAMILSFGVAGATAGIIAYLVAT